MEMSDYTIAKQFRTEDLRYPGHKLFQAKSECNRDVFILAASPLVPGDKIAHENLTLIAGTTFLNSPTYKL